MFIQTLKDLKGILKNSVKDFLDVPLNGGMIIEVRYMITTILINVSGVVIYGT